jgi:hypothetical protein
VFGVIAIVVYSPWMIRNSIWTGNPFYPLFYHIFDQKIDSYTSLRTIVYHESVDYLSRGIGVLQSRAVLYNEPFWKVALVPVRIFFQGQDGSPQYFDGRLNPWLFILPFFAVMNLIKCDRRLKRDRFIFCIFSFLFVMIAFFSVRMRIRYIAPVLPFLTILSVYALHDLNHYVVNNHYRCLKKICRSAVGIILLVMLCYNGDYLAKQFQYVRPVEYVFGKISREDYITRYRPEYPLMKFSNSVLDSSDRILGLFIGKRIYFSDNEILLGVHFFGALAQNTTSADDMLTALKKYMITHVVVNLERLYQWTRMNLTENQQKRIRIFFDRHTALLFSQNGFALFAIKN